MFQHTPNDCSSDTKVARAAGSGPHSASKRSIANKFLNNNTKLFQQGGNKKSAQLSYDPNRITRGCLLLHQIRSGAFGSWWVDEAADLDLGIICDQQLPRNLQIFVGSL